MLGADALEAAQIRAQKSLRIVSLQSAARGDLVETLLKRSVVAAFNARGLIENLGVRARRTVREVV